MFRKLTWALAPAAFMWATAPAHAACDQLGTSVICSGAATAGFGDGTQNGYTVTVQPDASIALGAGVNGIWLNQSNTVTNNGTITTGDGSFAIRTEGDGNILTNNGLISLGAQSSAILVNGVGSTVTNNGTISSSYLHTFGLDLSSQGSVVTNTGTIALTGSSSNGINIFGANNTVFNSGTITVGNSASTNDAGVFLFNNNTFTNTGTINALGNNSIGVDVSGDGNTLVNNGVIRGTSGLSIVGMNESIVNNGTIAASSAGGSIVALMVQSSLTNNGTIDGQLFVNDPFNTNTFTNAGLITITDPNTPVGTGHLFQGTFSQTASGVLALRVNAAGAADTFTTTTANLGGTLRAVLQPGTYAPTTSYSGVFSATNPLNGRFDQVTTSSTFYNAVATYNSTSVDLTLTRSGFGAVAGETANQRAVGNALEAGYSPSLTGAAAAFYSQLLAAGSVRVLDQLSGEGTSGTQNTAFAAGSLFGQTIDSQMDAWRAGHRGEAAGSGALGYAAERPVTSAFNALKAPPRVEPQWHAWASGFGAGQSLSGDATVGSAGFSDRVAGGAVGVDHLVGPDLLVGIAAGGSSATFNVDDRATSGRLDGAHVGGYAMQRFGASYVSGQLGYSHFNNSTTRTITGIGADEIAKGSFGSDQFGGRLEVGRSYDFGTVRVTPFAALQAARLWQAGYTETSVTGAGPGVLGLSYASRNVSSLPTFLGSKFDARFTLGNGMMWMPFGSLAWVHEFSPNRDVTASLISMPVPAFTVEGARAASDAGRVELGSRLVLNRWSELSARFTGEFSSAGRSYAGTGTLRVNW
ncbi:autotransporter domain-containing protein [Bradyrhizobium sp. Cp5.3]|uniref:autotransporter outer membrane beta-barrel domain-containing protein n=1 Tax=Bradyrhizobium sp. Cp5.3 TaxID=443598 RepID=UPI000A00B24A|nr:autotransporter outer membrane beta-barrel domain-containing protein [Bradyrhizobium sp. Cp5.3]